MEAVVGVDIKKLKADNNLLAQNFDNLKQAYKELEHKYVLVNQRVKRLEEEKRAIEERHNAVTEEWRDQLNQKATEFDELRLNLPGPINYDQIKLQCFAEFRKESKAKFNSLSEEVVKWRNLYNSVRKDHEKFKIQLVEKEKSYQSFIEDLQNERVEERNIWSLKMKEKDVSLESQTTLNHTIIVLQRDLAESDLKSKALLDELSHLKKIYVEEQVLKQSECDDLRKQAANSKLQLETVFAEKESLKITLTSTKEDLRLQNRKNDEIAHENQLLRNQTKDLQSSLRDLNHQHKMEVSNIKFSFEKELTEEKIKAKRLETDLSEVKEQEKIFVFKQSELEGTILFLQNDIARLEQEKQIILKDADIHQKKLKEELQNLRLEYNKMIEKYKSVCNEVGQKTKDLEESNKFLEESKNRINTLERKEQQLLLYISEKDKRNVESSQQIEKMNDEIDILRKELSSQSILIENSNNGSHETVYPHKTKDLELDKLLGVEKENNIEISDAHREEIQKFNLVMLKLKSSYKQKIRKLKDDYLNLKSAYDTIVEEKSKFERSLENESQVAKIKLEEELSKQQMMKNILKAEGAIK